MAHWITDANKKRIKVAGNYGKKLDDKLVSFVESERLKTLNLFNKDGASASRSYGQWGLSLYDLVPTKALGSKITISFSESMREIRFTTTDENGPLVTHTSGSYIALPMDSDWWINNRSAIFMYVQKSDGTWINKFSDLITLDIMVTYGTEPQAYIPYYGDIVHKKEMYPVNSLYIAVDSTDPAELFGGKWELIAENVNMPLGLTAGFTKTIQAVKSTAGDGYIYWNTTEGKPFVMQVTNYTNFKTTANSSGLVNSIGVGIDLTAFDVDLTSAENSISGVYIWKRYE